MFRHRAFRDAEAGADDERLRTVFAVGAEREHDGEFCGLVLGTEDVDIEGDAVAHCNGEFPVDFYAVCDFFSVGDEERTVAFCGWDAMAPVEWFCVG